MDNKITGIVLTIYDDNIWAGRVDWLDTPDFGNIVFESKPIPKNSKLFHIYQESSRLSNQDYELMIWRWRMGKSIGQDSLMEMGLEEL